MAIDIVDIVDIWPLKANLMRRHTRHKNNVAGNGRKQKSRKAEKNINIYSKK